MPSVQGGQTRSAAVLGAVQALRAGSVVRERLPALPAAGLMLVLAGAAFVWDPQGFNGYLAAKVATAGAAAASRNSWRRFHRLSFILCVSLDNVF